MFFYASQKIKHRPLCYDSFVGVTNIFKSRIYQTVICYILLHEVCVKTQSMVERAC